MDAGDTLRLLAGPLAFLFFAAPLAALLDELGFFAALADRLGTGPRVAGRFWLLATATVVLVNLDAAVVLLSPLAVQLARRTGRPDLPFAAIPAVLALLASSALPVSNLTNLVVVGHDDLGPLDLLANLGLPTAVAVTVGWLVLRPRLGPTTEGPDDVTLDADHGPALRIGVAVLVPTVVAFVALPALDLELWPAALAADLVLMAVLRHLPWRSFPVVLVAGVALVAVVLGRAVDASGLDDHRSGSIVVVGLLAAGAANLVNNLPALLGGLELVTGDGRWALLLGVNAGAGLLLTGSLSTLLWRRLLRGQGVEVSWRAWSSIGVTVVLPAFVAALAALWLQQSLAG